MQFHVRAPISKPLCLQQQQGGFRKPVFVGASPTRGSSFNGDHDVTAASRPVKAFVPVRIRLVTPIQGRDAKASISACEADCAGANPVALTIFIFDGPKVAGYRTKTKGVVAHRERAAE